MRFSWMTIGLLTCAFLPFCSFCAAQNTVQAQPAMHVLIFADNNSSDIRDACQQDRHRMLNWLSDAAGYAGLKLLGSEDKFTYSKAGVDSALRVLKAAPNDVIVFYYTGHGIRFEKQTGQYPYLDFYKNEALRAQLNLEEVHQKLKAKGARLTMTIGDLCNVAVRGDIVIAYKAPIKKQIYQKLFLAAEGDLLVTSSSPGQSSNLSPDEQAGLFTSCWLAAADRVAGGKSAPAWEDVLNLARDQTIKLSTRGRSGIDSLKNVQAPLYTYHLRYRNFQIR